MRTIVIPSSLLYDLNVRVPDFSNQKVHFIWMNNYVKNILGYVPEYTWHRDNLSRSIVIEYEFKYLGEG